MSIIYVVFNNKSENGSVYIGKTKFSLEKRKQEHEKSSRNKPKTPFHKALKSYGIENFTWYEILEVANNEINDLEKFYITEFIDDGYNLYNISPGGEGGDTITSHPNREEITEKMRKSQLKRYEDGSQKELLRCIAVKLGYGKWMVDKKLTEDHKNNISKGIQLALLDEEKRDKISHKGQKKPPFSKEHREKLSLLHKNKPKSEEHKQRISKTLIEYHKNKKLHNI